jgi:tetratricopeptide (TPR) repeat protein
MCYLHALIVLLALPTFAEAQAVMALSGKDHTTLQYIDAAKKHIEQGKYQDALAILETIEPKRYKTLEAFTKGSLFGVYFNMGTQCLQKGDYALAVVAYEQAKVLTSDDFRVHYSLGICYRKTNNYGASVGALTKAIELNPGFASAHFNLGSAHWKVRAYDKSLAAFEAASKADPNHVSAQYMIGLTSWSLGNYKGAAHAWDRVLKMNPNHKKAKKWLSRLHMRVGSG